MRSKILYKYRDWSNSDHRHLLTDGELFLSSPKDFNDPFDCRISHDFSLLNTDEKIIDFVNRLISKNPPDPAQHQSIDLIKRDIFDRIKNNLEDEQAAWDTNLFAIQDKYYG